MFRAVCCLGEQIQRHFVVHHVDGLVHGVAILVAHRPDAVTNPENRQDTQPTQYLGSLGILEDIASCDEHLFLM